MGKKVKKDDKGPPDDVFDPLLVESHQAGTVVLMLESPEEDVLAKACEAIYKFVEKSDENRKALHDLGAADRLLKLVTHEDKIVRRNATMALGVMAGQPDVRKYLRKRDDCIPALVNLLSPEESTIIHEFAGLCLSSLAQDYSSKVRINEQGAMEPLLACLGSDDPDVQKNAIETIALLLQDYESKSAVREQNGFPPMLELLKSEYPVIQHLALVALQRATEDGENRGVLRDLEGLTKLIDFIGHPEWSDLHVFAVMVISNLLDDVQSMELIKENGGLAKLVAFITDTAPAEEEDKKGKEKSKSRAGKKGKDEESQRGTPKPIGRKSAMSVASRTAAISQMSVIQEAGRESAMSGAPDRESRMGRMSSLFEDDKHKSKGGSSGDQEQVVPTLPEVKEHASRAIARAAKNADNRKLLHEQEVEKMLILLLSHEEANVQVAAAQALGVMSENLVCREAIGQWDGLEPLIKMMKSDNPDVREASSMAVANLTSANMNNCRELMRLRGLEPLIELLSDTREFAISNAAIALTNMGPDEGLRSEIQRLGVVKALIEPLSSNNPVVQSKVALTVSAFVVDSESRALFRECGGVAPLVKLLSSGNDEVRRSASWAISVIAVDESTAAEVSQNGGLEVLQEVQLSSTRKNAFTDMALDRLLDSNLSAKYALTGYLSSQNRITDGFFDVGQLKPGTHFLSLEEYAKQEINQRRPVLLINAKPLKPETPPPQPSDLELNDKTSKSSLAGRSSRTGKDSRGSQPGSAGSSTVSARRKSRHAREREERPLEEEVTQTVPDSEVINLEVPYVPPGDSALLKAVEEVNDRIQPLPTTRDQVVALAQYVSDKLGGSIDRGQVANFSWELPLAQLKFDLQSNVVPLGMLKGGIHCHRALLFKALADRIAVGCSLQRGEYNRAWNEVLLADNQDTPGPPKFPPKPYIVDLVHQPGRLLRTDSNEASSYRKL